MSWTLWRALHMPPYKHPLFRRTLRTGMNGEYNGWRVAALAVLVPALIGSTMVFPFLAILIPVVLVMFHGTLVGVVWTASICGGIARERQCGNYALLAIIWEIANRFLWRGVRARLAADSVDTCAVLEGAP